MTLLGLSPAVFGGLLALLAASLFVLHLLRVRPRVQVVPTLQFWREAQRETRARTVFGRFRHPLTWAFLLLVLGTLLLAIAEPETDGARAAAREDLLVVDLSDGLTAVDASGRSGLDRAREALGNHLRALGLGDRATVLALGDAPVLVVGAEAPRPEALERVATLAASGARCDLQRGADLLAAWGDREPAPELHLFTDRPGAWRALGLQAEIVSLASEGVVDLALLGAVVGTRDVTVTVANPSGAGGHRVLLRLADGETTAVAIAARGGEQRVVLPRDPATGGLATLSIDPSDALATNDTLTVHLGQPIAGRLALEGEAEPVFRALVAALDATVDARDVSLNVVVTPAGEGASDGAAGAPLWTDEADLASRSREAWPVPARGLRGLASTPAGKVLLTSAAGDPLAVLGEDGATLLIAGDLVAVDRHLVDRPDGAARLATLLAHAAGQRPGAAVLAAGAATTTADGATGDASSHGGAEAVAHPVARAAATSPEAPELPEAGRGLLIWEILAAGVLLLLLVDAWLHGRRRIP